MRLLLELLVLAAVIALGWEKSFQQSLGEVPVIGAYVVPVLAKTKPNKPVTARAEPVASEAAPPSALSTASATPPGAWMWDPKRQGSLDRPGASPTPPTSFTGHIYYTDENGKKYWIDGQGKRHYD